MNSIGWLILGIIVFLAAGFFFSVNAIAARIFSHVKLQDVFKNLNKEDSAESFFADSDKIVLSCSLLALAVNIFMIIFLLEIFGYSAELSPLTAKILAAVSGIILMGLFESLIAGAWAIYAGEKILARTYPFLKLIILFFAPLASAVRLHNLIVRRLAGVADDRNPDAQQEAKEEEFLSAVEQGKLEGVVDEVEQEMIEQVLELSDTTAEEIMTPRTDIIALKIDSNMQTVLDTITSGGHSRIPVYEDTIDGIVGLVYAKDLLNRFGKEHTPFNLRELLRDPYFVPETKTLRQLLREFQEQKLHIAIVLDEYGGTAGIVTIEDIIEEVVGEIADEYEDIPAESMKRIDDSTVEVDARIDIDDFNEEFEAELPEEEDYDTVGGFVFSHLGYIPQTGETFEYGNLKFTIIASERRKINRIKIQKLPG
ncbi:MAG: hemolysin family protein [Phycisphaerae bacterium]|nr:hemolysin family protein [Phycisphaerae bacterium]